MHNSPPPLVNQGTEDQRMVLTTLRFQTLDLNNLVKVCMLAFCATMLGVNGNEGWYSMTAITWVSGERTFNDWQHNSYGTNTVNFVNIRTPKKNCCNHPKIWTRWLYQSVMHPKDAAGIANSVDPDQTALLGAVWSGSALFAQADM